MNRGYAKRWRKRWDAGYDPMLNEDKAMILDALWDGIHYLQVEVVREG